MKGFDATFRLPRNRITKGYTNRIHRDMNLPYMARTQQLKAFRLPKDTITKLERLAKKRQVTQTSIVRNALEVYLRGPV